MLQTIQDTVSTVLSAATDIYNGAVSSTSSMEDVIITEVLGRIQNKLNENKETMYSNALGAISEHGGYSVMLVSSGKKHIQISTRYSGKDTALSGTVTGA